MPRPARARVQISVRRSGPATRPALARRPADHYIGRMCRRVIQSSAPLRYAIVDGMNVQDSRLHDDPSLHAESHLHETRVTSHDGASRVKLRLWSANFC